LQNGIIIGYFIIVNLQILAAIDVFVIYTIPSCVLLACYWRILVAIRQRKIHDSHSTATKSYTVKSSDNGISMQEPTSRASQNDSSTDTINSTNNGPGRISHNQMNILQTMIIIATSFVILWMPVAFAIILVYFEVSHFSLDR
jgi:hypothetical protein